MHRLVECVPNFSEGRRPEVIGAINAEIEAVPGVTLLDSGMDADHNRAVVTFVGEPGAAVEAAFRAIAKAAELIDITKHRGEYPRIGSTDVVPFVPLGETTMDECVRLADELAERVGSTLGIPVYLYEQAARRPDRRNLANIRRGEYEALSTEIATSPERAPDYGPARLHPTAGAIAIGARSLLIVFNVNLSTPDVGIAKAIAARIREGPGGLEAIRALGIKLSEPGLVQIAMSILDFRRTSLAAAYHRVEELAAEYGVQVRESEIVGLVPEAALFGAVKEALKLVRLERRSIIEERMKELIAGPFEVHTFLEDVSSTQPSPGGGSVAALAGALAAASVEKVVNLTRHKPRFAHVREEFDGLARSLLGARWDLLRLVKRDAAAYETLAEVFRMPSENPEEERIRREALVRATLDAARTPLEIGERILVLMRASLAAAERGNPNVLSDAVAASAIGRGALEAAWATLRVNLAGLKEADATAFTTRFEALRAEAATIAGSIEDLFEKHLARKVGK